MKTKTLITSVICFFCLAVVAQPIKQWDKRFGGTGEDQLMAIERTSDGGYILGGTSHSGISGDKTQASRGNADYWIVKVNSNGVKEWDSCYGGSSGDYLRSMVQTADGGYILGGETRSGISGDKSEASRGGYDYWIIKVNSSGAKEWDKTFGGNGQDWFRSVRQTSDGGYIVGGWTDSGISGDKTEASHGGNDLWIVKVSSSGMMEWDRRFGGSGHESMYSLCQTSDGGCILGGSSSSPVSGDKTEDSRGYNDYWIVKVSASGAKEWDKRFGGNSGEGLSDIRQTMDGGYILGGESTSSRSGDVTHDSRGQEDYWIVKVNGIGEKEWDARFGGSSPDYLISVRETFDGGYILGGSTESGMSGDITHDSRGGDYDIWIVKTNAYGVKQWDARYGGNSFDFHGEILQTTDGGYIIGGTSSSDISGDKTQNSQGGYDMWIIKLYECAMVSISPSSATICSGQSVTLTASATGGTSPYSYSWSTGATSASITVSPTTTTTYQVTVTSSSGCTVTVPRTVTVNRASVTISSPSVVCRGSSATLTATGSGGGSYSYFWSTGASTRSITVSPASTTSYSVTVESTNGCTATITRSLPVQNVTASISPSTTVVCRGSSITLTANGSGAAWWESYVYIWSTGANTRSITVSPLAATTYTVTVSLNGCTATASRSLTVQTVTAVISITGTGLASQGVICRGTTATLTANGSGGSSYAYVWSTGASTRSITVSPLAATTYTVTVVSSNGCTATASRPVNLDNVAVSISSLSGIVCPGTPVRLTASATGSYGPFSYLWSTGSTSTTMTARPHVTTNYRVTVTSGNGCTATASRTVGVGDCSSSKTASETDDEIISSLDDQELLAADASAQFTAYPNPFRDDLAIQFSLPKSEKARVEILNIEGRLIATLFNGAVNENEINSVKFQPGSLPEAMYICRMTSESGVMQNKKVMLAR